MQPTDFMDRPKSYGTSKARKANWPLLAEIKAVMFSCGSTWRQKEERAIEVGQPVATKKKQPRGISSLEKADIIKKLTPLMSAEKGQFWHDLSSSFDTSDLNTNVEWFIKLFTLVNFLSPS